MLWGINIAQVTTRYSSTRETQLTQSNLSVLAVYHQVSVWLVVFSATHKGFSRFLRCFISTKLKHWGDVWGLEYNIGLGTCYNTFQVKNTKWLWLVNDTVTTLNSDNLHCATFGLYPSYVAWILNSVKQINLHVLCNTHKLRWIYWKIYWGKECTFKLHAEKSFLLTSGCDTVEITFEARPIHGRLPPGLIFALSALRRLRLSSLGYGVVCIKKRLTYIKNYVLTSRHECKFDMFALDLDTPRSLVNSKFYTRFCLKHPPYTYFPPEYCSVLKVLTVCLGKMSAYVNYVLKSVLQV